MISIKKVEKTLFNNEPYVYVKDAYAQQKVIEIASQKQYGGAWTTANVVIKGSN